jgi:hypothetical protein
VPDVKLFIVISIIPKGCARLCVVGGDRSRRVSQALAVGVGWRAMGMMTLALLTASSPG